MSQNYPYRRTMADFSSHQGVFSTSDHLHDEEHDIGQTSLQPSPCSTSIFTSSKNALESYSSQRSTTAKSALSLLSSCGLEPADLSILAGMPENMITEETLPRLLMEIRQKKALRDRSYPSTPHHSTCHQSFQPSSDKWENSSHSSPAEYSANPSQGSSYPPIPPPRSSYPLPREENESWKDRWGKPRQTGGVRQAETSGTYIVDYNYGQPQEGDSQNLVRAAYSRAVGIGEPPYLQSSSNYRQLNPTKEPVAPYRKKQILSSTTTVHSTPTAREANDFHGAAPQNFPYACSLCDIAVLSQKDWTSHINGSQHADSQLAMLQMYPDWDCRIGSARQTDSRIEKGREEKNTGGRAHGAPQHYGVPSSRREERSPAGDKAGGRVVCAKYAADSMDECSLRRLVGRVGTAVNLMMFPVQAFIEMSSPDEADVVVKYFKRNPVVFKGYQVEFTISATYNFLQNSPVVIFSLLPPGNEKYPEILAIAKRFGPVKHSLFLPNRVLMEMGSREDAGKLVQYYTSHPLKMKGRIIQVSHSTQHSTLNFAKTDKDAEDGEASRRSGKSYRSQNRSSPSPRRRSPSPRRSPDPRKSYPCPWSRSPSPRRRSPNIRRRSCSPRRGSPSPKRRSYSPRRRSPYTRRRSPSPRRRSPIQRRRSPGDKKRSPRPRRNSMEKRDVATKIEDKASRSSSSHRSLSSGRSTSQTREDKSNSIGHSVRKTADTQKAGVKGNGMLTETPDVGSSQEPSCTHTQTKEGVPSPKEHIKDHDTDEKTQDQIENDSKFENDSDMDSDIEGMAVIGEDEEMRSEEGSMESLEEMEEHVSDEIGTERNSAEDVSTCPSEVAKPSEDEVEAGEGLAGKSDKEPGSQSPADDLAVPKPPGVNAMQVEKQMGQKEVEEPHEAYEEDEPDFPESLEHCITLDELEDDDIEHQALSSEGNSDQRSREEEQESGRVLYIQNLPCGYYTDKEFVAIGEKYGKVNRYFLIRRRQEGFIEMERSADAQRAVRELSKKRMTMDRNILVVYLSRKYKRLTCGWKHESDSDDSHEQRKFRKERRRGERENSSSITKSRTEDEPPAKKTCIREEKTSPAEPNSAIEEVEKAAPEEISRNNKQQQEEDEKAATEETSSNNKQQQQQQEDEEKRNSETHEQEQLAVKTENEDVKISQLSDSVETQKTDTEGGTRGENGKTDGIKEVCVEEEKVEKITEPSHVPLGPYQPNSPIGREFVSQKIGYFCSLCNAIYVTEDEARNEHCRSLSHYEKLKVYLEQNGHLN